jgi:hypothetical protein
MMFANRYESPTPPQKTLPHQPPRISFFISRNNGNIVPLIPADELPYSVRLSGVQRSMRMENTCGMQHVGNLPFTGQYFRLETEALQQVINTNANHHKSNSIISAKQFLAPDAMIRQNTGDTTPSPTTSLPGGDQTAVRQVPASTTATTWRRQGDALSAASTTAQATIDAILASEPRPAARSIHTPPGGPSTPSSLTRNGGTNTPDSGDKVYCTHWIRHGECDYIQQGCRYKHEMPNKATLQSIGFRTVPRWWQEKVAVQLGQSAIPIVGDGLKPSEWMKLKKRSLDSGESSSSDDDSESDCEFDESEDGSEAGSEVDDKGENEGKPNSRASVVKEICLTPATKPMMKDQAKISTLPSAIKTSTGAVPTTEKSQAPPVTSIKAIRKPSLAGSDLIDLSHADSTREIFPAFRSSCPSSSTYSSTTLTYELNPQEGKPTPTISASAPSQTEKTQLPTPTPSPPRKVFVPAGESKEYHIAHARRTNAVVVPSIEVPAVRFTLGGGHAKEVATAAAKQAKSHHHQQQRQQAKNSLAAKKRPTLANFASGKGMMASVHAPKNVYVAGNSTPTPTAPPPSPAVVLSPTSVKQQQQRKHLLQQAKKSKPSGNHGSRSASSSSSSYRSPTLPSNDSNDSLKTSETVAPTNAKSREEEAKSASKGPRPIISDACRPRRPAGQAAGKEARPRSKQTAPKVAGGVMKV